MKAPSFTPNGKSGAQTSQTTQADITVPRRFALLRLDHKASFSHVAPLNGFRSSAPPSGTNENKGELLIQVLKSVSADVTKSESTKCAD